MSREIRRVALDFEWPLNKRWPGYCIQFYESIPEELEDKCAEVMGFEDASEMIWEKLRFDPPIGEGWQMWEDCTEGSPISPVFKTPEELAQWLADNKASAFGSMTATYEQWLATIKKGYAIGMVCGPNIKLQSGVEYNAILDDDMGDK